jgi:hypothetical protein
MSSRNNPPTFLESLAPYRLPSVHSNPAYRVPLENRWIFLKIYGPKKPRWKYEIRRLLGRMGLRQPVEYQSPGQRKSFEEETLRRWKEKGYAVPEILASPFPELSALPHLSTTFLEGCTLGERLTSGRISVEEKRNLLSYLFEETARRHGQAITENDRWLFHIDANTRNILYDMDHDRFYHVDFEMGRHWESTIACAAREILKLLTTAAEDMKPTERTILYQAFQSAYPHEEVYRFLRENVYGRPFQGIHRWKDRRKKEKNPRRVTVYDILDHICRRVTSP